MRRREFLLRAGLGSLTGSLLSSTTLATCLANAACGAAPASKRRTLVLIELKGGNDGLNTLVPFRDSTYYKLRPRLAISKDEVLPLTEAQGLHPALGPLMPLWKAGEFAIVQGLGYAKPNRSHFRSIAIWETGSGSRQVMSDGWLLPLLTACRHQEHAADALVLGRRRGPVAGSGIRVIHIDRQGSVRKWIDLPKRPRQEGGSHALAHVLEVEQQSRRVAAEIRQRVTRPFSRVEGFPAGRFGQSLQLAATVISAGLNIPVIKLELTGFDTHTNQANIHRRLLNEISEGVSAMCSALTASGNWENVLVMTYSEFGRRVAENGSGGTDHGTAAPHFLFGGRVKGGIYGQAPSLNRLEYNDLMHTTDYRSVYQTVAAHWFGNDAFALAAGEFPVMNFLSRS